MAGFTNHEKQILASLGFELGDDTPGLKPPNEYLSAVLAQVARQAELRECPPQRQTIYTRQASLVFRQGNQALRHSQIGAHHVTPGDSFSRGRSAMHRNLPSRFRIRRFRGVPVWERGHHHRSGGWGRVPTLRPPRILNPTLSDRSTSCQKSRFQKS